MSYYFALFWEKDMYPVSHIHPSRPRSMPQVSRPHLYHIYVPAMTPAGFQAIIDYDLLELSSIRMAP